jgi:hypothetical protein
MNLLSTRVEKVTTNTEMLDASVAATVLGSGYEVYSIQYTWDKKSPTFFN